MFFIYIYYIPFSPSLYVEHNKVNHSLHNNMQRLVTQNAPNNRYRRSSASGIETNLNELPVNDDDVVESLPFFGPHRPSLSRKVLEEMCKKYGVVRKFVHDHDLSCAPSFTLGEKAVRMARLAAIMPFVADVLKDIFVSTKVFRKASRTKKVYFWLQQVARVDAVAMFTNMGYPVDDEGVLITTTV